MKKKKDVSGVFVIKGKQPWMSAYSYDVLKKSEIPHHIKYIKKNTGAKRIHYNFLELK